MEVLDPLRVPAWDDMLRAHPDHSFFHTSHWARVLRDSYGYLPRYFATIDRDRLTACVPLMEIRSVLTGRRGVSLPFTDQCRPLLADGLALQDAIDSVIQYGRKAGWRSIEVRSGDKLPRQWPAASMFYGHTLALLTTNEELFAAIKDSTRRNIRKARREGVNVVIGSEPGLMAEFCRLNCLTRKAHGLPPQPRSFFDNVYNHVIAKGHGCIALARHQGNAVAAAVFFHFGSQALFKYGASNRHFLHLRPNELVLWEAIQWYRDKGCASFSFGRTEAENSGLLQFKAGWGAEEHPIYYYKYDLRKNAYVKEALKLTGMHNQVFSRMPIPLLKFAGSLLYRHMG